ncbi:HAD family hydrolase [Pseudonocardia sp. MCCB 268]|nr:HAD family hydrolase [Pseudonocardia cytotoxica]
MTARTRASIDALLTRPETATLVEDGGERQVRRPSWSPGRPSSSGPASGSPATAGARRRVRGGHGRADRGAVPVRRAAGDDVRPGPSTAPACCGWVLRDAADTVAGVCPGRAGRRDQGAPPAVHREGRAALLRGRRAATVALLAVPLLFGAPFEETLLRAIVFMIVASPCAIVLATMPPLLAALAVSGGAGPWSRTSPCRGARRDRHGRPDKTGTLTSGRPQVVDVTPLGDRSAGDVLARGRGRGGQRARPGPRGAAARAERGLDLLARSGFEAIPGEGVRAVVDGHEVAVGRPELLTEPRRAGHRAGRRGAGRGARPSSLVDSEPAGVVTVAVRTSRGRARSRRSRDPADRRHAGGPHLVTRRGAGLTSASAGLARLTRTRSGLLPAGKVEVVGERQASDGGCWPSGDGINDAPLLASADVGLVVGEGAGALSLEAADGVSPGGPAGLAGAGGRGPARRARPIAQANLAFAATVIVVLVAWDLIGT